MPALEFLHPPAGSSSVMQPTGEASLAYAGAKAKLFAGREWLVGVSDFG